MIITRTLHRSLLLGLLLVGLRPVWVRPEVDPGSGLPAAVAVEVAQAPIGIRGGASRLIRQPAPGVD